MQNKFWAAWFRFTGCSEEPTVKASSADNSLETTNPNNAFIPNVTLIVPDKLNPSRSGKDPLPNATYPSPVQYQGYAQGVGGSDATP
jgi:hypothetical protein